MKATVRTLIILWEDLTNSLLLSRLRIFSALGHNLVFDIRDLTYSSVR